MKKFIVVVCILVVLLFGWNAAYYRLGIYIDLQPNKPVTSFMSVNGKTIFMEKQGIAVPFEIRGVDMGVGFPGKWATDFAIGKETYKRWFKQIQELGANTIRVYTILHDDFYNAFYEYNQGREEPLYLLHGVWINDYMANSHRDAYDEELFGTLQEDCKTVVDIIHGKKNLSLGYGTGSGSYRKDISQWVIGYIIGVEWESSLVTYTNQKSQGLNQYSGIYLYTTEDATAFEGMLCRIGDQMIEYESKRYKQQRLVAFANWPTTDPFVYPVLVSQYRSKVACVDVEKIRSTDLFFAGMFASYHVYPYFPDYLEIMREGERYSQEIIRKRLGRHVWEAIEYHNSLLHAPDIREYLEDRDYYDSQGCYNTYIAYLRALNRYHNLPVIISEYGVTTGRGMAQRDVNTGRNQGHMTEQEQGMALIDCYRDIMDAGCAGSCVFTWQDEWFKRTWNTMNLVDLNYTAYWSDYQTNEQYFGLLAFDPGMEKSVCYVDGDASEWTEEDLVTRSEEMELSLKYDEKFIYFLVKKEGFQKEDILYLPIDTTPKTGSTYCQEYDISFEQACDFLIVIDGTERSRILVQKRYEALLSTYGIAFYRQDPYINPPEADTPEFERIYLPLILSEILPDPKGTDLGGLKYETGKLRFGNGNPESQEFDSLADFMFGEDFVEIRVPWQLLNFSNPSDMMVHDDYYEHYGIENLPIKGIYVGAGYGGKTQYRIPMEFVPLKGWGKKVTFHERLKESYYLLQEYWKGLEQEKEVGHAEK